MPHQPPDPPRERGHRRRVAGVDLPTPDPSDGPIASQVPDDPPAGRTVGRLDPAEAHGWPFTPDPPGDAELRANHPTPRPPHPDDPRVGIAANAIGWELRRHNREVTEREDGNAQITVTAAEAAADRAAAERVVAHLDGYAASHAAEALDIRPGDTLIVRYPSAMPEHAVDVRHRVLSELLPDVQVVVLRADGMARYRPDQAAMKE